MNIMCETLECMTDICNALRKQLVKDQATIARLQGELLEVKGSLRLCNKIAHHFGSNKVWNDAMEEAAEAVVIIDSTCDEDINDWDNIAAWSAAQYRILALKR